jgi:hypothetical protein
VGLTGQSAYVLHDTFSQFAVFVFRWVKVDFGLTAWPLSGFSNRIGNFSLNSFCIKG